MEICIDELRLLRRALRYSVAHLNVTHNEARADGRTHEAIAAITEAQRLSILSERIHDELIKQLQTRSIAESITAGSVTRRTPGCGADCTNLCATGSCPNRQPD